MNRNHFWKLVLILGLVFWSLYQLYPPQDRPLVDVFRERAVNRDPAFGEIMTHLQELQKTNPLRQYGNLIQAAGTNDLRKYFPFLGVKDDMHANQQVLNRLQREAAGKVRLGIDLKGGTSFMVEMKTNTFEQMSEANLALDQAVEVLRKRVDRFGVAEPVIQRAGGNRILIQLPGLSESDKETAMRTIQQAAFLEFRLVHPQSQQLIAEGVMEPGYKVLSRVERDRDGKERQETVLVKRNPEMTGSGIRSAMVVRGNLGEPQINFTLDDKGAVRFGEITREHIGQRLAIILDGELYSAPTIQSAIETGSGQITGQFSEKEAFELANVLQNPLRAPLEIVESREVDPTLGTDSIRSGIKAALIGTVAVSIFVLGYYLARRDRGEFGPHPEPYHPARGHVLLQHHAHVAGHRGHRAHRRYGSGCERADLRAHPGGDGQG